MWVYADEGEEIPGGKRIDKYLHDRVRSSSLFIPVVSKNSMKSVYTRMEVACALACQADTGLRIIPLVETSAVEIDVWPDPFSELRSIRYHEFNGKPGQHPQLENAVARICQDIAIPYVGIIADTPRLPLMQRVENELEHRVPRDKERANTLYFRLQDAVRRCKAGLADSDYVRAAKAMEYFIAMAENEYEGLPFYYPYVVRAVCLIALGRLPESAEQLTLLRSHPEQEETVFGMLGYIRQVQGLYAEAASLYREALNRDPDDPAAATGVVVNELFAGERGGDMRKACHVIKTGHYLSDDDRDQAQEALALGLAGIGESEQAAEILYKRASDPRASSSTSINLANVLVDMERYTAARNVLIEALQKCPDDAQLARHAMRFLMDTGQNQEAVSIAQKATELMPDCLDVWFERLVVQRRADLAEAFSTAEHLAGMLPKDKNDYYYTGYANWVLGRYERASYDLERSGELEGFETFDKPSF